MSVLLETSVGDIVIDLEVDKAPRTCDNFLKLCAIKYYNDCTFHNVQRNHTVLTGDPTNTGTGGQSVQALLAAASASSNTATATVPSVKPPARFLQDELDPSLTHARAGTVGMSNLGVPHSAASQFYITTSPNLHSLDGSHTVFGHVAEGMDVLERINATVTDERGRPTVHIRIRHTAVLDDPFPMPDDIASLIPPESPPPINDTYDYENINPTTTTLTDSTTTSANATTAPAAAAAINPHAVVLEMIGDLPSADAAPPENVLFVCKLNPVTRDDDLQLIFSRFGRIVDCSIVRDGKTGASLGYGFIEYESAAECEAAYVKMDNVLIDDRRIRVDFSQSVSRQWKQFAHNKRTANTHKPAAAVTTAPIRLGGGAGLTTVAGRGGGGAGVSGERKSRWGDSRSAQPSSVPRSEERQESAAAVEDTRRDRDSRDEVRDSDSSKERRHRDERRRRSRSRERSTERTRRARSSSSSPSRSQSRSREKHKHSSRDKHRHSKERDRDRHREKDRDRHRRSRSPRDRHRY